MKYKITTGAKVSPEFSAGYDCTFKKRRVKSNGNHKQIFKVRGGRIVQATPEKAHRVYPVCGEDGGYKPLD
jgi:hypothetical protein